MSFSWQARKEPDLGPSSETKILRNAYCNLSVCARSINISIAAVLQYLYSTQREEELIEALGTLEKATREETMTSWLAGCTRAVPEQTPPRPFMHDPISLDVTRPNRTIRPLRRRTRRRKNSAVLLVPPKKPSILFA